MTNSQDPFHQYPAKYPKARRKAVEVAGHIHRLVKNGPRTVVGTVVDTSFHTSAGYVSCTTQLGSIVNVFGVPYGSVVNGMRIFCRQIGGAATNRSYVYDGAAPNLSGLGYTGSFAYNTTFTGSPSAIALTFGGAVPTSASIITAQGYFAYWFFYIPALPTSNAILWQLVNGTNVLSCTYLPNGRLQISSQDGHGYATTAPVSAHNVHWCILQPGLSGLELLVDMVAAYSGLLSSPDIPTFIGGSSGYQLSLLSDLFGNSLCPLGTWISKFSVGTAWNTVYVPQLQSLGTGLGSVPSLDSELPCATAQQDVSLTYELLCEDVIGSSNLVDSAGAGGTNIFISSGGAVQAIGPY
jgi:hypothetical protein